MNSKNEQDAQANCNQDRALCDQVTFTSFITKDPDTLAKTYRDDANGKLDRQNGGKMYDGAFKVMTVSYPDGFIKELESATHQMGFSYCTAPVEKGAVETRNWIDERVGKLHFNDKAGVYEVKQGGQVYPIISRTKRFMKYAPQPGILMIDVDQKAADLKPEQALDELCEVYPGLADALVVTVPSSSSGIINGETGKALESHGFRLYFGVADALDIPNVKDALYYGLALVGRAHIKISKAGTDLVRFKLADLGVYDGARLDFTGGAVCEAPYVQTRSKPRKIGGDQAIIDTAKIFPAPTDQEKQEADSLIDELKLEKAPERERVRNARAKTAAIENYGDAPTKEQVQIERQRIDMELESGVLFGGAEIVMFPSGDRVAVQEICDMPERYIGKLTCDPIDPSYDGGRQVGKILSSYGAPYIHSYARGGGAFALVGHENRQLFKRVSKSFEDDPEAATLFFAGGAPANENRKGTSEWVDPTEYRDLADKVKKAPEYQISQSPPLFQKAVREVSGFYQVPPSMAAFSGLGGFSLLAQGLFDVQTRVGITCPTSLYTLSIADSGARKSATDKAFGKSIEGAFHELYKFMNKNAREIEQDHEMLDLEKSALKSQYKALAKKFELKTDEANKISDRLGELNALGQPTLRSPRIVIVDDSNENLAASLQKRWPSSIIRTAEGGAFFGGQAGQDRNAMKGASLRNMIWSGETYVAGRVQGENIDLRNARLSISISVQRETFEAHLTGGGQLGRGIGEWARYLIDEPAIDWGGREIDEQDGLGAGNLAHMGPGRMPGLLEISNLFAAIADRGLLFDEDPRENLRFMTLRFCSEGQVIWNQFYNEVERTMKMGAANEHYRDIGSKTAEMAGRIAACFHLMYIEWAEKNEDETYPELKDKDMMINPDCVRWGCHWARVNLQKFAQFFAVKIAQDETDKAVELEEWLIAKCGSEGVAELSRREILMGKRWSLADAMPVINLLTRHNRIKQIQVGKSHKIAINPALL